jgi:SAM-dependent methyltransferase
MWRRARAVVGAAERVLWGGARRERVLVALLRRHYDSLVRRRWGDPERAPHFFDHRIGSFAFATGTGSPFGYYRGYFAAELIRSDDVLLDIGCGDGFFDRRFFAPRCAEIDAIDVDPQAIAHASRFNPAENVRYLLRDAVAEPFPRDRYDVVVWDGGLGHVSAEDADRVLEKIRDALTPGGAFVGSESLGEEGTDHLQFFSSLDDFCRLFAPHFPHVQVRRFDYELPDLVRAEAFWRCALDMARLDAAGWRRCS